jgi:ubiquinone/menaquinone biosynthesis C-methylase UbiE
MINLDNYTNETMNWLDQRFKITDHDGVYFAHQPIYGFRKGHCEPGTIIRYMITYQIMKALSHLKFNSLLDVGGAEGYKAALVRSLFNVNVRSVDLSGEACKRAKEIFDVDGEPVDIHKLPYKDEEFDVVLCSETLEHVSDIQGATEELLRVCKKAVIITVPRESKEVVEKNIRDNIPHAHIHSLDTESFDFANPRVSKIITRRFHNPIMKIVAALADATKKEKLDNYPLFILKTYNLILPLLRLVFYRRSIGMIVNLDDRIANQTQSYSGMIFILLKDESCYSSQQLVKVTTSEITNFAVPIYYLK